MLRHPADSLQWKKIDRLYPDFGKEARNLRLGLATDGMNPYGSLSTQHSSWPILLMTLPLRLHHVNLLPTDLTSSKAISKIQELNSDMLGGVSLV